MSNECSQFCKTRRIFTVYAVFIAYNSTGLGLSFTAALYYMLHRHPWSCLFHGHDGSNLCIYAVVSIVVWNSCTLVRVFPRSGWHYTVIWVTISMQYVDVVRPTVCMIKTEMFQCLCNIQPCIAYKPSDLGLLLFATNHNSQLVYTVMSE